MSVVTTQASTQASTPEASTGQTAAANYQVATETATGTAPSYPEWMASLPDDVKKEGAFMARHQNVESLAKSYIHAQKMIGMDKIPVPSKHATEDDWKNVFQKLGLPDNVSKYELQMPSGMQFEDNFTKQFKENAFEAGILPKQAEKLMAWYGTAAQKQLAEQAANVERVTKEGMSSLQNEWGKAFDFKVSQARTAVKELTGGQGDSPFIKFLENNKIDGIKVGDHPEMIKLLTKIGESYADDKIIGGGQPGSFRTTPEEANAKWVSIAGDPNHPYFDKGHAGHDAAVKEVNSLFEAMSGS